MGDFSFLINSVQNITGPMVVMWLIGGLLIWLAIKKDYEPALLLPMGFGAILVNLPDTGVLFAKLLNIFLPKGRKINPMVGGAGISAFPMSARVIQKMALKEDNQNHLLMHAVGANVAGQIGSVVAGGIILSLARTFGLL